MSWLKHDAPQRLGPANEPPALQARSTAVVDPMAMALLSAGLLVGGCALGTIGDGLEGDQTTAGPGSSNEAPYPGAAGGGLLEPEGQDSRPGVSIEPTGPPELEGFALLQAGTFTMGSPPSDPDHIFWNGIDVEKPHQVTLTHQVWMGETEITQAQYESVMGVNPSVFHACGSSCPVENVTWYQAILFCNRLSAQEEIEPCYLDPEDQAPYDEQDAAARKHPDWPRGHDCLGYRLPTEAEWEYAARGGTTSIHFLGDDWKQLLGQAAWIGANSQCSYAGCENDNCRSGAGGIPPAGTHPVGQKLANPWGLHDTSGSVWEFVWDFFGEYHDGPVVDPVGPMAHQAGYHVARGGSWLNGTAEARSATRDGDDCTCDPDNGPGSHTGFRICRTVP